MFETVETCDSCGKVLICQSRNISELKVDINGTFKLYKMQSGYRAELNLDRYDTICSDCYMKMLKEQMTMIKEGIGQSRRAK